MDVLNYQDGGHNLFTYNHHNNNSNTTKRPHSLHLPYNLNFDGHHDFEYIVPQNATQSSPHYLDRYSTPLGSSQLPGKSLSTDYNYSRTPYSLYTNNNNNNNNNLHHSHSHQNIWLDKRSHDRIQHWLSEQDAYTGYPPPETESILSLRSASSIRDVLLSHPPPTSTFAVDDTFFLASASNNNISKAAIPITTAPNISIFPKHRSEEFLHSPVTLEEGNDKFGAVGFNNKRYSSPNCIRRRYVSPRSDPALDTIGIRTSVPARSISCRNLWPSGVVQNQQQQEGGGGVDTNNTTNRTFYQSGGVNTFPRRRYNSSKYLAGGERYTNIYPFATGVEDKNSEMGQQLEKYQQRVLLNPYATSAATIQQHEMDKKKNSKGVVTENNQQKVEDVLGDGSKEKSLFVEESSAVFSHGRTFVLNGINLQQQQQQQQQQQINGSSNNSCYNNNSSSNKSHPNGNSNSHHSTTLSQKPEKHNNNITNNSTNNSNCEEGKTQQKRDIPEVTLHHNLKTVENEGKNNDYPVSRVDHESLQEQQQRQPTYHQDDHEHCQTLPTTPFHARVVSAPATTDSRHLQRDTFWRGEVAHRKISREVRRVKTLSWPKRVVLPEQVEDNRDDQNSNAMSKASIIKGSEGTLQKRDPDSSDDSDSSGHHIIRATAVKDHCSGDRSSHNDGNKNFDENVDENEEDVPPARPPLPPEHVYSKRSGAGSSYSSSVATPVQQQQQQQQYKNNRTHSRHSSTSRRSSQHSLHSHLVNNNSSQNKNNNNNNKSENDKGEREIVPVTAEETCEEYYHDVDQDEPTTTNDIRAVVEGIDVTRALSESGYVTTHHHHHHHRNHSNEQLLQNHPIDYNRQNNKNNNNNNNKSSSACELSRRVSMSLRDLIRIHEKEIARVSSGAISTRCLDKIEESNTNSINNNTMTSYSASTHCVKTRGDCYDHDGQLYYHQDQKHEQQHPLSAKWKRHTTIGLLGDFSRVDGGDISETPSPSTPCCSVENVKNKEGCSSTPSLMSPSSVRSRNFNFNVTTASSGGDSALSPWRRRRRRETFSSDTGGECAGESTQHSSSNLTSPRSPKNIVSTFSSASAAGSSRSNLNLRQPKTVSSPPHYGATSPPLSPPPPHTLPKPKPKKVTTTSSVLLSPLHAIEPKPQKSFQMNNAKDDSEECLVSASAKTANPLHLRDCSEGSANPRHSRDCSEGSVHSPHRDFTHTEFSHRIFSPSHRMHDTAVQTEEENCEEEQQHQHQDHKNNRKQYDRDQNRHNNNRLPSSSTCNEAAVKTNEDSEPEGDHYTGEGDQFDDRLQHHQHHQQEQNHHLLDQNRHVRTPSFIRNEQLVNELATEKETMRKAFDEERRELNKKLLEQQKVANAYQKLEDRYRKKVYELQRAMKMCTCASENRFFPGHHHDDQNRHSFTPAVLDSNNRQISVQKVDGILHQLEAWLNHHTNGITYPESDISSMLGGSTTAPDDVMFPSSRSSKHTIDHYGNVGSNGNNTSIPLERIIDRIDATSV